MSDQNKTSKLAMFGFPVIGLLADAAIIHWRGIPAIIWVLASVVAFIVPLSFIPGAVKNENDDSVYWCIAIAVFLPIIILAAAT